MIGTKFYKPLELDKLTRTVTRTVTREEDVQVAVPVEREYTHTVQDPVYKTVTADDGTHVQVVAGYTEREVTEKVQDIEYRTEKRTVTEEVPEQEEYDNPAPNTLSRYREAAEWCNKNRAKIEDKGAYYEVVAIPEPTAKELAAAALPRIDSATSAAILAGFEYEVEGEPLHFSYDSFDQQNFADTANAAMLAMQGVEGVPQTVTWNGWRNHNAESKGELVRLTLDVQTFLGLYTGGALVHKATLMEIGGQRKAAIEAAETVEEIEALLEGWGV